VTSSKKEASNERRGRNPQICGWNFELPSLDISTSGLVTILLFLVVGRRRNHLGTLFELAMVVKLHFVSTVTTILILDLTCNINQHDHEISIRVWRHA